MGCRDMGCGMKDMGCENTEYRIWLKGIRDMECRDMGYGNMEYRIWDAEI